MHDPIMYVASAQPKTIFMIALKLIFGLISVVFVNISI